MVVRCDSEYCKWYADGTCEADTYITISEGECTDYEEKTLEDLEDECE
jgi:hypothetical protein